MRILYAIFKDGFPIPRDFALAFYAESPLKPGDTRKVKLKINGKRYDALFQCPGPAREYRIVYDAEGEVANALVEQLENRLKPGEMAFALRTLGKTELIAERLRRWAD